MHAAVDPATRIAAAAPRVHVDGSPPGARLRGVQRWLPVSIVAVLTLAGVALRLEVAHQSLFADELSTYWIIRAHGLAGVISTVHSDAEITPPLYFVLSWLTTQIGHGPELVRGPSLVAGAVSIPMMYRLGLRTVGRPAALVATALTALAPFMIYYSAEARAYGLMMALVIGATLAMLVAVDTGRARWWVVYAGCSCAAVYTHYTSVFLLAAQLLWLLWAHPEARRPAIVANVGALIAFLPWTSGVINDFSSPTSKILSALSPFTLHDVRVALEHWSVGYPYANVPLRRLPGAVALVLLAIALLVAVAGLGLAARRDGVRARLGRLDRRIVLVGILALSVPVGEAVANAVSTHLFGVRNLAAAWPAFALLLAALLVAAGPRLRFAAAALAIASFAIGAVRIVESHNQRPAYQAGADFVDHDATPGDVVVDETGVLSPGPLTPIDVTLHRPHPVFRAGSPAERDHPFGFFDPIVRLQDAIPRAVAAAGGRRVYLVSNTFQRHVPGVRDLLGRPRSTVGEQRTQAVRDARFPAPYRLVEIRRYPGIFNLLVRVYAIPASPSG